MVSEGKSIAHRNDSVRRLFAEITALLETAHEHAIAGQGADASKSEAATLSNDIRVAVGKICDLASEIDLIIGAQ